LNAFRKKSMTILRNEKGSVFLIVLMLMLIMTLVGIMAIDTATIDIQIAGNLKRTTTAFEGAEGGVDVSIPVIERTMAEGSLAPAGLTDPPEITGADATNLGNEILGGANNDIDDPICEDLNGDGVLDAGEDTNGNGTLENEDLCMNLNGARVGVDIDRLISDVNAGNSLEFASGYEGIGAGAAGGGMSVLFRIRSQGTR